MIIFFGGAQGSEQGPVCPTRVPKLLSTAFSIRSCQIPLRPLLTLDRFPGHGLSYPAGSDSTAIRRTILPKSRLVRWLSASKSQ
jgi:hypothetical protein